MHNYSSTILNYPKRLTVILFCALTVLGIAVTPQLWDNTAPSIDFPTFYYSAISIVNGSSPYNREVLQKMSATHVYPYVYSPVFAESLIPLTGFSYHIAESIFIMINIVAVAAGWCILFMRNFSRKIASLLLTLCLFLVFPFRYIFNNGQMDGILFFFSCCLFLPNTKSRYISFIVGFAAILKHAFISLPMAFISVHKKKYLTYLVSSTLLFIILSIIFFGSTVWKEFLEYTFGVSLQQQSHSIALIQSLDNFSLAGILSQFIIIPEHLFFKLYTFVFTITCITGTILSFRQTKFQTTDILLVYSCVLLICAPFLWKQHFVYIAAPLFIKLLDAIANKQYIRISFLSLSVFFITLSPKVLTLLSLKSISNIFPIIGLCIIMAMALFSIIGNKTNSTPNEPILL